MKCVLDSRSECTAEEGVNEMVCIRCMRSHQLKVIFFLAESLKSVRMRMDRAISIGMTLQTLVFTNEMFDRWIEKYYPEVYEEMREKWKKQEAEYRKKIERLMGKDLSYRA